MTVDARRRGLPMTAAYFRLITRRFGTTPARRAALLRGTGVSAALAGASGDAEITVGGQLRQLANLDRLAPAGWGLDLGATLDGVSHGAAGVIAVTAATLGDAIDALAGSIGVRTPFVDVAVSRGPRHCTLRVVEPCALDAVRIPILEMVLLSLQATIESALGRRLAGARFVMPAPRPAHWWRYAGRFHAPLRFAGDHAALELPASWLAMPCPLADRTIHRHTAAQVAALRQRLDGDFIDARVERLLAGGDDAPPALPVMARRLAVSPRTLVRRLGERHTSYRALRERHRRARAADLLAQPALSVAEIAERLGYDEATNFARACRRWFGLSPRAYRQRLATRRAPQRRAKSSRLGRRVQPQ